MNKQELAQLKTLLIRFRDEQDFGIGDSVRNASKDSLAFKLHALAAENIKKVDFTIRWVSATQQTAEQQRKDV